MTTFGEVLLRLTPPDFQRFVQAHSLDLVYGGGEANVAVSLSKLGLAVDHVTRLPDNEMGEACLQYLHQHGVGKSHVLRGGSRIGIYFLEMGAAQRPSKVIYDRAGSSFAELEPGMIDWEMVLADSDWLHWTGIIPAVSASAAAACLEGLKVAREMGLTISCDISHRSLLWKWGKSPSEVLPEMLRYCDIAFGLGAAEAQMLFDVDLPESSDKLESYETLCVEVQKRSPSIKTMAATFRDSRSASRNGLMGVIWKDGAIHASETFDISTIVDRIGGGDAYTAGIIYGLRVFGDDYQKTVDFATAASVLKHSIPGDFNLVSLEEVENLMGGNSSGRIAR